MSCSQADSKMDEFTLFVYKKHHGHPQGRFLLFLANLIKKQSKSIPRVTMQHLIDKESDILDFPYVSYHYQIKSAFYTSFCWNHIRDNLILKLLLVGLAASSQSATIACSSSLRPSLCPSETQFWCGRYSKNYWTNLH